MAAGPAVADAGAQSLTLTNLGQAGLYSTVPQPPLGLTQRGSCSRALGLGEANGGAADCSLSPWPAMGGDWAPALEIAGGDLLELRFADPAQSVEISSTTNFPLGLVDPGGSSVPNVAIIPRSLAQSTADPRVWTVIVPNPLDKRAISPATFSVAAVTALGARSFAASLLTPRYDNYPEHCGRVYYGTNEIAGYCARYAIPPGGGLRPPPRLLDSKPAERIRISLSVIDMTPRAGQVVRFSGRACPAHDGLGIRIQRRTRRGVYRTVRRTALKPAKRCSVYRRRLRIYSDGMYRAVTVGANDIRGISRRRFVDVHR